MQPGRTATVTFVVPADAGEFEYGCFLPGHYEGGMKGALTIEAPGAPAGATAPGAPATTPASTAAAPTPTPTATPSPTDEHAGEGH